MAKHPDPTLPDRHTLYVARTGGGKSQAMKQNPEIPTHGARVLIWDNAHDQWRGTHYFSAPGEYGRHVARAIASGRGFRLGYDGERSPELFEWWCQLCWAALDGRHQTWVLVEELGRVCITSSRAGPQLERLVSEGRKYGLRFHATNQRTQEVPKTVVRNCQVRWAGPADPDDLVLTAKSVGAPLEQLQALRELQFLVRDYQHNPLLRQVNLSWRK